MWFFGRLTKEVKDGILKTYTYDDNSNRTGFVLSSGGVEKLNISYTYDALNRLLNVSSGSNTAIYAYDKNSNVISLSMGDKISNTYAYNKANLLTAQTDSVLGKTYALSYNVDGNISSITETGKPSKTYTYDNTGKLVSETSEGKYTADYTFDNRQNRITKAYTDLADGGNNAVINYTYNLKNQLVSEQKTCGSKLDITDYEYDFNGNLYTKTHREYDENPNAEPQLEISQTPSGIERYTFNALDMPVSANINGIETTYTYDGNNLRTSKTSGGTTTEFLYDGVNVIGEKTNTDVKTYIRGKEILLDSDGIFYHHDTHGSVSALVNAQNEVLAQNIYDAYGAGNISHLSPFGYCGEYFDSETGFVYLRNRYYDPNTGRFISQDPIKDGDNWYVYANNNPVKYIDPLGLDAIVLTTSTRSVYMNGHTSVLAQGSDETWYYFYWGNKNAVLLEVPSSKISSLDILNGWLVENGAGKKGEETDKALHDSSDGYTTATYVEGDFSASIEYFLEQIRDADIFETIDRGKYYYTNTSYDVLSKNCMHVSFDGLKKGALSNGTNFGEFVKWDGNGSIRPNDFRVMVRETFSNQEITKSAARNSAIGTIGKKKPWYMSQNYYDQGQKYGKMLRDS